MKQEHEIFVREMLQHGDKFKAYKAAYPDASGEALKVAARRLMQHPDVQERIWGFNYEITQQVKENIIANTTEQLEAELVSIEQKRKILGKMISGGYRVKRQVRVKDHIEEVEEDLNPYALLRAIELDTKLANDWYEKTKTGRKKTYPTHPVKPLPPQPAREPKFPPSAEAFDGTYEEYAAQHLSKKKQTNTPLPQTQQNVTIERSEIINTNEKSNMPCITKNTCPADMRGNVTPPLAGQATQNSSDASDVPATQKQETAKPEKPGKNDRALTPAQKHMAKLREQYKPNRGYTISSAGNMKFPRIKNNSP